MSKDSNISSYDLDFILDGHKLKGVTSVDGSYSITETPINVLGYGYTTPTLSAPFVGNFSVNREFLGEDPLLPFTGDVHMNGAISYGAKNFGFTTGYLDGYSIACSVGEVPTMTYGISIFGKIGGNVSTDEPSSYGDYLLISDSSEFLITTSPDATDRLFVSETPDNPSIKETKVHPEIFVPEMGSIIVECAGSSTDRVTNFNYNMSIQREPIYTVNSSYPVQVCLNYPIEIDATFTLAVDSYEAKKARDYLIAHTTDPIKIKIMKPALSQTAPTETIHEYSILNPELLSESIEASPNAETEITLSYKGYINKR